jgi:hypothetical protein
MTDAPAPPTWVIKRDGRQEPFDPDKISRALFASGEDLGRPDAFLARELADGVVHFLAAEAGAAPPTTAEVAELVAKVVRELGQPALAEAFEEFGRRRRRGAGARAVAPPRPLPAAEEPPDGVVLRFPPGLPAAEVLAACARSYTLQAVFARDLVAAQADGLLTLTGLDAPGELEGLTLAPGGPWDGGPGGLVDALEAARAFAAGFVALDGPEYALARAGLTRPEDARAFARELIIGLRVARLGAVVNLNCAGPPAWASDLAGGPLFAGRGAPLDPADRARLAGALAGAFLGAGPPGRVRVDWHLAEADFAAPAEPGRLAALASSALRGAAVAFVFDRPRRPAALAEGVDRRHPAALLTVGVHLPRLATQPGVGGDPACFLAKLPSLARLALSAGVQKREFLRRRERGRPADGPALSSGFLLDRARLVVAPVGLDAAVRAFTGRGLADGGAALDLGREAVARLRDVLREDGRRALLETCLDGPADFHLGGGFPAPEQVAGLTPWDPAAAVRDQLRAGGALHAGEAGTQALFVPEGPPPAPEQAADWLRATWQRGEAVRVRLVRPPPAP